MNSKMKKKTALIWMLVIVSFLFGCNSVTDSQPDMSIEADAETVKEVMEEETKEDDASEINELSVERAEKETESIEEIIEEPYSGDVFVGFIENDVPLYFDIINDEKCEKYSEISGEFEPGTAYKFDVFVELCEKSFSSNAGEEVKCDDIKYRDILLEEDGEKAFAIRFDLILSNYRCQKYLIIQEIDGKLQAISYESVDENATEDLPYYGDYWKDNQLWKQVGNTYNSVADIEELAGVYRTYGMYYFDNGMDPFLEPHYLFLNGDGKGLLAIQDIAKCSYDETQIDGMAYCYDGLSIGFPSRFRTFDRIGENIYLNEAAFDDPYNNDLGWRDYDYINPEGKKAEPGCYVSSYYCDDYCVPGIYEAWLVIRDDGSAVVIENGEFTEAYAQIQDGIISSTYGNESYCIVGDECIGFCVLEDNGMGRVFQKSNRKIDESLLD